VRLADVAELDQIVTALPIVQEVVQGLIDEPAFRIGKEAMLSLPLVESPLEVSLFLEAAQLYRSARRAGLTIRSATDCLIAACAIRHHLTVVHVDRDFDHLSRVSSLRSRRIPVR